MRKKDFIEECMVWITTLKDKRYKILTKADRRFVAERCYEMFKPIIKNAKPGTLKIGLISK